MASGNCSSGKLTAFVAGALAGAAAAFLLSPKSGRENRRILGELGEKFLDELQDRYDVDREDIKKKGKETLEQGREYLAEKRKELNEAIRAGREAMEKEKKELERVLDPDMLED